jgi:hypothetical protein
MVEVLVGAAIVLAAVPAVAEWMRRKHAAFQERFPAISDADFLARFRPGIDPVVALGIRRLVAKHFAIEYARVHPAMTFIGDIGAD